MPVWVSSASRVCVLRHAVGSRVRSGVIPHKMGEEKAVNRAGFPDLFLCPVVCVTQSCRW